MITARVTSLVGPLLCVLALGAVAVAAREPPASRPPMVLAASVPSGPWHLPVASAPSCPLSLADQVKSVKAFAEMMPVFHHPRCFNCHGGFDITSDEHEGSDVAKNSGLDPRSLLTAKERKELHAECGSCHDNVRGMLTRLDGTQIAGWLVAPLPMLWNGKSDDELCLMMKRFERDGAQFIEHIEKDHNEIQFVEAAFNGDRALGEALTSYGLQVDKPPGTQAELTAKARRWVAALNGIWKDPPECGCVMPRIELRMKSEWTGSGRGSTLTKRVSVTVPLEPDSSGLVFKGTAPLKNDPYSWTTPPGFPCRIDLKPLGGELAVTEARFDVGADQRMTISLAVIPTMNVGTATWICPKPWPLPFPFTLPILQWADQWKYLHQPDLIGREYHFDQFDAASGLSLAGEPKLVGRKEVIRNRTIEEVTMRAKTTFEFWWVGLKP